MRTGISISVSALDRRRLKALVRERNAAQKHAWRAEIILLSADAIGTTSFTLPAGSLLSFTKQAVSDVVFVKDTKATVAGAADTLHAGEGIRFDSKGVATKYTAEEAE